jgi:hypothetical protein
MKEKLRQAGAGMATRWSPPPGAVSDASYTTYRQVLFEGEKGRGKHIGGSIWQHRTPEVDEK